MRAFCVDLSRFSIEWLQKMVQTTRLLPSEVVLAEETEKRLSLLRDAGYHTVADLARALQTPKKRELLSSESGIPLSFLTVLRRRIGVFEPKPVPLAKILTMSSVTSKALAAAGITDSRQLFERIHSSSESPETSTRRLAEQIDIGVDDVSKLASLCDFLRGPYVGPAFAELMWQAGFRELGDVYGLAPDELHDNLVAANAKEQSYKQGIPGGDDLRSWLVMVNQITGATTSENSGAA